MRIHQDPSSETKNRCSDAPKREQLQSIELKHEHARLEFRFDRPNFPTMWNYLTDFEKERLSMIAYQLIRNERGKAIWRIYKAFVAIVVDKSNL